MREKKKGKNANALKISAIQMQLKSQRLLNFEETTTTPPCVIKI